MEAEGKGAKGVGEVFAGEGQSGVRADVFKAHEWEFSTKVVKDQGRRRGRGGEDTGGRREGRARPWAAAAASRLERRRMT